MKKAGCIVAFAMALSACSQGAEAVPMDADAAIILTEPAKTEVGAQTPPRGLDASIDAAIDAAIDAGPDAGNASCSDLPRRHRYGMNIDPANPGGMPTPQELHAAGVRWVRVEWKVNRGAAQDAAIATLRAGGIRVLLLIDYSSVPGKPASNGTDVAWGAYLTQYVAGVERIAAAYRDGVDAWEIWNESDLSHPGQGYDPGVPAKHFGVMLRDAKAAIRKWSKRPVVVGGLASGDPTYLASARNAVGGIFADAVGVHPYGQRAPDNFPTPTWGFGNMTSLLNAYAAFGLPIWLTEIGTDDPAHLADYLTNVYTLCGGPLAAKVPIVFWFAWSDSMVPPFGVLDGTGTPKPAFARYTSSAPVWDPLCDGFH